MTIVVFIQGLCLWLTAATVVPPGAIQLVVPDFSQSSLPHFASISIPIKDNQCPDHFQKSATVCTFNLDGAGQPGGVKISFAIDDSRVIQSAACILCGVPNLPHATPLTLKPAYSPDGGASLAAQLVMAHGSATWRMVECTSQPAGNCPRYVEWTMTSTAGGASLVLENLQGSPSSITVPLSDGANVSIANLPPEELMQARVRRHTKVSARMDMNDWCLYYQMFEDSPPCIQPLIPPACEFCPPFLAKKASKSKSKPKVHGTRYFDTIACSNSHYP